MYKVVFAVVLACSFMAMTACQSRSDSVASNSADSANANASATTADATSDQKVTIDSPDGLKLVGTFYPSNKPASPGVLLLHQWQSDRHSYDDFAKKLQSAGFAVLSIDGRGFGESTRTADGKSVTAERTDAAVKGML